MVTIIDKRQRAQIFRDRLTTAMQMRDMTRSALSRAIGVDRSTISQLLIPDSARLPNAQLVGDCAMVLGVSADWLLGLSNRPENAAEILANSLSVTKAARALVDEQVFAWHQEAAGYKIRHVPASLPDMLKTPDLLHWEYAPHLGRTTKQAIGASQDRLDWMRNSGSDYEIALPLHEMQSFVRAEGYYAGLPTETRLSQIDRFLALHDQLYPRLRLSLFDARRMFSAPVTVFGPLLAVVYLGRHYLAFRDSTRIASFIQHFDGLIRQTVLTDRDLPDYLHKLRQEISG